MPIDSATPPDLPPAGYGPDQHGAAGLSKRYGSPFAVMAMQHADVPDLDRFVQGQKDVYKIALGELRHGEKQTHWMWFIFPQLAGLGRSPTARRFAIADLAEAQAYLRHPVLGARLVECAEAVLAVRGRSAQEIFGSPDDVKLRSSATLFARASAPASVFERILDAYFGGEADERTVGLLKGAPD